MMGVAKRLPTTTAAGMAALRPRHLVVIPPRGPFGTDTVKALHREPPTAVGDKPLHDTAAAGITRPDAADVMPHANVDRTRRCQDKRPGIQRLIVDGAEVHRRTVGSNP